MLVLAAVTAVIASSFLFRSAQEARLATRSYYQSVALNLAEAGVEEALFAMNTAGVNSGNNWSLASGSTTAYVKSITSGFNFQQATGAIYIRIDDALSTYPTITATAVITIPQQPMVLKQIRVRGTSRRLWGNGIVAKSTVTFSGSATVDSYDSNVGPYNSATNRTDRATVATQSAAVDAVVVGSTATIYGYVATGGSNPNVGTSGRIYGATSPLTPLVDPTRVRKDFNTNLPDVTVSTGGEISLGAYAVTGSTVVNLPRAGDVAAADGRYRYTATSLTLGNDGILNIKGPVDIIISGNISIANAAYLAVGGAGSTDPSLNLYCSGSLAIGGAGMVNNTNTPSSMTLYGTAATGTSQTLTVNNAGSFIGSIYAPNGNFTLANSGGLSGAVVVRSATLSGTAQFHYDVQLATRTTTSDTTAPTSWVELTDSPTGGSAFARDNREPFASLF